MKHHPWSLLRVVAAAAVAALPLRAEVPRTISHQGRIAVDGVNFTGDGEFKFRLYTAGAAVDPAQVEATVSSGQVTAITIVHGGSGYVAAPAVTVAAPKNGTTATATAAIDPNRGTVSAIVVTAGGSGYATPPQTEVELPGAVAISTRWSNSYAFALPGSLSQPPLAVTVPVENGLYSVALGDSGLPNMSGLPDDLTPPPGAKLFLRIWFKPPGQGALFEELWPHQAVEPVPFALHARTAETLLGGVPIEDGLLVTGGAVNVGDLPAEGPGARLMWYSAERAFRVGEVTDLQVNTHGLWDEENLGRYSTAMGYDTLASGHASVSLGEDTSATGSRSVALGWGSRASGNAALAAGQATLAEGDRSFAVGESSEALHDHSAVLGYHLKSGRARQTVVGAWNVISANSYFVVGGGTGEASRKNLLTVDGEGDVGAIRHVTASGAGNFGGQLSTDSSLDVDGNGVVDGFFVVGGPLQVNSSATITGDATVRTLTITGGADLAEPFDLADPTLSPGTVVVIDDTQPGRLAQSESAYDTRVAGIISGAGGIAPGLSLQQQGVNSGGRKVALTGRVYVHADAAPSPIKPGDLLTTSATPGHAMRAANARRAQGAILGKAMSRLDSGRGLVLVLVTLQ